MEPDNIGLSVVPIFFNEVHGSISFIKGWVDDIELLVITEVGS